MASVLWPLASGVEELVRSNAATTAARAASPIRGSCHALRVMRLPPRESGGGGGRLTKRISVRCHQRPPIMRPAHQLPTTLSSILTPSTRPSFKTCVHIAAGGLEGPLLHLPVHTRGSKRQEGWEGAPGCRGNYCRGKHIPQANEARKAGDYTPFPCPALCAPLASVRQDGYPLG